MNDVGAPSGTRRLPPLVHSPEHVHRLDERTGTDRASGWVDLEVERVDEARRELAEVRQPTGDAGEDLAPVGGRPRLGFLDLLAQRALRNSVQDGPAEVRVGHAAVEHEPPNLTQALERACEHTAPLLHIGVESPLGPPVRLGDELGMEVDDVVDGVGVSLLEEARERSVAMVVSKLAEPVGTRVPDAVGECLAEARPHPREVDAQHAGCLECAQLLGLGQERSRRGGPRRFLERLQWRATVLARVGDQKRVDLSANLVGEGRCRLGIGAVEDIGPNRAHDAPDCGDGGEQDARASEVLLGPCDEPGRSFHMGRLTTDERFEGGPLLRSEWAHAEVAPDRLDVGGDRRLPSRVAGDEIACPVFTAGSGGEAELARDVAEHVGLDFERPLTGEPPREPDEGDLVGEPEPGVVMPQASDLDEVLVGEPGLTREGRARRVRSWWWRRLHVALLAPQTGAAHRLAEGPVDVGPRRLVVDLCRLWALVSEEPLEQVLRHPPVGQTLRRRVAEQVRVDPFGDSSFGRDLLHDLLDPALRVLSAARRREEVPCPPLAEVKPEFVGEGPEDRHVACFVALVNDPHFEVGERDVVGPHPAEGADAASSLNERADHEPTRPALLVGLVEQRVELLRGQPVDGALAAAGRREPDAAAGLGDEVLGLVVGVAAVAEELGEAADIALAVVVASWRRVFCRSHNFALAVLPREDTRFREPVRP